MSAPTTLNGYPVIDARQHGPNLYTVQVFREEAAHPYVVATWWPALGGSWMWGHYDANSIESDDTFQETCARNDARR